MSRFKDQLLEMGNLAEVHPDGELVFRVPLASLKESPEAERRLIGGAWRASVEVNGSVIHAAVGGSGEHALEWLTQVIRRARS